MSEAQAVNLLLKASFINNILNVVIISGSSFKETVPDKEEVHTTDNLKNAINKLRKRIADVSLNCGQVLYSPLTFDM